MFDKHAQDLERLLLKLQLDSVLTQLARPRIYFEDPETNNLWTLRLVKQIGESVHLSGNP